MRIGGAALPSGSEYCVPDSGRSPTLNTQTPQAELSFADAVDQFNTGDRDHCIAELLEPQHHSNALLDASVVLFNQVIELLRYFDDRSLVSVGREPSAFSSRTAR